jgi:hypothetical protein
MNTAPPLTVFLRPHSPTSAMASPIETDKSS